MYQFSYNEILEDSAELARARERKALVRVAHLLEVAREKGAGSVEWYEAFDKLQKLWSIFIEDLSSPENALPQPIRSNLISIGIWILKEADSLQRGASNNFDDLIAINTIIAEGLVTPPSSASEMPN